MIGIDANILLRLWLNDDPAQTKRISSLLADPVCRVSCQLEQAGGGVEVTLRVLGMTSCTPTAKSMAGGGTRILTTLQAICETGQPSIGTRLICWLYDHMEFVLPARTKRDHWPLKVR